MAASAPLAAAPPPSSAAFSNLPYTVRFSFSPSTPQFPSPRLNLRRPLHPLSVAPAAPAVSAAPNISVGDKLPDATLSYLDESGELHTLTVADVTRKKKVIIFAVPGAFAITCSQKHAPGFKEKAGELRAKGVEAIACVGVNDAFLMRAWKRDLKIGDEVMMLSDVNGELTRALGVEFDLRDNLIGLGVRSRRYALLAEDGVVKVFNLEAGGGFTFSGADDMLKFL